jgi:hypothetical protein
LLAAALSNSQRSSRSSLITRFSRISLASSASTTSHELTFLQPQSSRTSGGHFSVAYESDDPSHEYPSPAPNPRKIGNDTSYPLLGPTSPSAAQEASYEVAEGPSSVKQASARPILGVTSPLANPALPYPQPGHIPFATNICYACNTSFKNANTLAKHQTEFCERKLEWVCSACPRKVYGLQERLNRHHLEAHAEMCPHGCDKREKLHSEACKTQLSKCSRRITTKKAWGCPCCIKCFESLEEWSHHVWNHPVQNEKVQDWSFSTMIWSLLSQPYLPEHMTRKHWERCNWSTLRKEASQSLRHALERREVPADVMAHPDYRGVDGPAALARYAFNLGTTGKAYTRGCKTPRMRDTSPHNSLSPSSHAAVGSTHSPQHRSRLDPIVHSPVGWPLPAEEGTFAINIGYKSEASSNFRERVSSQTCIRPRQSRRTLADQSGPQISMQEDARHLPTIPSNGEPGYHRLNRSENQHMVKSTSNNPAYIMYPPVMPDDELVSSLHSAPQRSDSAKPVRLHYDPNDSAPRRIQTKKSQANLHGRFAYNRDPTLLGDEAPDLPTEWQDPHNFSLDTHGHMPTFDHLAPQRPHAASRPVTPARSEMSQGSWTKLLNTSSSYLPGARYSGAMSLSGPPSDVDMGWV